jgi:hypothetical protein
VQFGVDLVHQDAARPAMLNRFLNIERACRFIFYAIEQDTVMPPGYLCIKLLHNCAIGPCRGKCPHVLEVAGKVTGKPGKFALEISSKAVDDLRAPAVIDSLRILY